MIENNETPQLGSAPQEKWGNFLHWVERFISWEGFKELEQEYKLLIGERLVASRVALLEADASWFEKLKEAFGEPNNLTGWRTNKKFLDWCAEDVNVSGTALRILWDEDRTVLERFNDFAENADEHGYMPQIAETSFLHMAMNPRDFPIYRSSPVSKAYSLLDHENPYPRSSQYLGERYEHFLQFLDDLIKHADEMGVELQDRLTAQSVTWAVTQLGLPPGASLEDENSFEAFRNPGDQVDIENSLVSSAPSGGRVPQSSRDAILKAMESFDNIDRHSEQWERWTDDGRHKWAILHENRYYPVKEMIARAASTNTQGFSGGEESNRYLRSLGFIVRRIKDIPHQVWWVNQGSTLDLERKHGCIWAPKAGKGGHTFAHWTNLTKVQPGDIILHYANSSLRAVSQAKTAYFDAPRLTTAPTDRWKEEGYRVDTDYITLTQPIKLESIPVSLRKAQSGGPFNRQGGVNQGYLYPAPDGLLSHLVHNFEVGWPDYIIREPVTPLQRLFKIAPGPGGSAWDDYVEGGYICVGWNDVGDLRHFDSSQEMFERFREVYGSTYAKSESKIPEKAKELWTLREIQAGDQIIANKGTSEILGVGTVIEPVYEWLPEREELSHIIHVEWKDVDQRKINDQPYWAFKTILELPQDFLFQNELAGEVTDYSPPTFSEISAQIRSSGLRLSERTLRRFHLSLRTRGFVILAGVSGTGKTWLAEAYASAIGARHQIVAVAPNWTTNEDLLGYYNPVTERYHDTAFSEFLREAAQAYQEAQQQGSTPRPYHLVLDEMNLARVEYYFAGFLSAMEVRARHGEAVIDIGGGDELHLTPNLYVIGTVNIDETTHGFADKVWDRAQLVELDLPREELASHLSGKPYLSDIMKTWDIVRDVGPFAYRVVDDIAQYVTAAEELGVGWQEALDEQLLQKILPKLKGTNPSVGVALQRLNELYEGKYLLSYQRTSQMLEGFQQYGFASYFT